MTVTELRQPCRRVELLPKMPEMVVFGTQNARRQQRPALMPGPYGPWGVAAAAEVRG